MLGLNGQPPWTMLDGFVSDAKRTDDSNAFPQSVEPLWILGNKYSTLYDMHEIQDCITSKLWMTYRKNFAPIGGTGPTSDAGWGCMLRCGQMVLAEALITRHLGQNWTCKIGCADPTYRRILKLFYDKKDSLYSIHQIAQMGAMEGKTVGQWFGPNTIAQVLKKLSVYDKWSSLMIHVALDNAVVTDDIIHLCTTETKSAESASSSSSPKPMNDSTDSNGFSVPESYPRVSTNAPCNDRLAGPENAIGTSGCEKSDSTQNTPLSWKPLLLFIPLRLGLCELNPVYMNGLKNFFKLKQSVGIIGGKPNHALYFIGYVGDELIYLDPHTTQQVNTCYDDECEKHLADIDSTYHCKMASRMNILNVDPSLALCLFCESEADFRDMCNHLRKFLIDAESQPLFELCKERPPHWPPLIPQVTPDPDITVEEWTCDTSDEDFVLLG